MIVFFLIVCDYVTVIHLCYISYTSMFRASLYIFHNQGIFYNWKPFMCLTITKLNYIKHNVYKYTSDQTKVY